MGVNDSSYGTRHSDRVEDQIMKRFIAQPNNSFLNVLPYQSQSYCTAPVTNQREKKLFSPMSFIVKTQFFTSTQNMK